MASKNRAAVIHAAARLFLSQGYQFTSMDEIMEASGVSKSNIYYHFNSKEELLLAVVDFMASRYESALQLSLQRADDSAESRIRSFIGLLAEDVAARELRGASPFMTLYMQSPKEAAGVRERIVSFFARLQPLVAQLLAQGMAQGEFRADLPPEGGAELFVSSLEGALVLAEIKGEIGSLSDTVDRYFDYIRSR